VGFVRNLVLFAAVKESERSGIEVIALVRVAPFFSRCIADTNTFGTILFTVMLFSKVHFFHSHLLIKLTKTLARKWQNHCSSQ